MDKTLPQDHPDRLVGEMFKFLDGVTDDDSADPPKSDELQGISSIEDVPLRMMARSVAEVILSRGSVEDQDLVPSYARHFGVEVPRDMQRFVTKFAWSAKGRKFVALNGTTWVPGSARPQDLEQFGSWTYSMAVARARELLAGTEEEQVFDQLVGEVYTGSDGRVPRIVMSVVGKAIYRAKREL